MPADKSLLMLLEEIRGKTLRVLRTVAPEQAQWAPAGLQNTILWHAGHVLVTVESLAMRALGRDPSVIPGWPEMFSKDSHPARVPADKWPSLQSVINQLEGQQARLKQIISGLKPEDLDAPSAANPERTVRYGILHGLHDEANHCGEIHLLRKMQNAARPKA